MSNGTTTAPPTSGPPIVNTKPTPHQPQQYNNNNDDNDNSTERPNNLNTTETDPTTSLQTACADIHSRVSRFLSAPSGDEVTRRTQEQTRTAISVIEQALRDYDYEALSISYNGGKDCLVLLILYLSVIHTHFTQPTGRRKNEPTTVEDNKSTHEFPTSVPSIYAKPPDPFDSVTTFVESSTQDYHLDLTHISTNPGTNPKSKSHSSPPPATSTLAITAINGDIAISSDSTTTTTAKPTVTFRDAFALYLQTHPGIQAIFVGTRRTDPHGATLQHFQMTDGNWPRFMRVHPVIDWRLSEIWCFLRSEHLADSRTGKPLEYCGMYDAGYTSLGGVGDTLKNPRLRYVDEKGAERYRPAYEMTEDEEERAGRE